MCLRRADNATGFALKVERRLSQTLLIEVRGSGALRISERADDADDVSSDPVQRWVAAINLGLLGGSNERPSRSSAAMGATRVDPARQTHSWEIEIQPLDWGSFVVLLNLLRARDFDDIVLRSAAVSDRREPELDLLSVGLPELPPKLPFAVVLPEPEESPELVAEISFNRAWNAVFDAAILALNAWAELILLGGYAAPQ